MKLLCALGILGLPLAHAQSQCIPGESLDPNPFASISGGMYAAPTLADVNGDGNKDLVVGNKDGTINVYLNNGNGTHPNWSNTEAGADNPFASIITYDLFAAPTLVDVNGDGNDDLVVGFLGGAIEVWLNSGSDTFVEATGKNNPFFNWWSPHGSYAAPTLADVTGDGKNDLVVGNGDGKIKVWLNSGSDKWPWLTEATGTANPFASISGGGHAKPTFADVDGDGNDDLIIGDLNGAIDVYLNNGNGTHPNWSNTEAGVDNPFEDIFFGSYASPTLADVNDDGNKDLVVGYVDGTIKTYGICVASPTAAPTKAPTAAPTITPTGAPTADPTGAPTANPTLSPIAPTKAPTPSPTKAPTAAPTITPTGAPTAPPVQCDTINSISNHTACKTEANAYIANVNGNAYWSGYVNSNYAHGCEFIPGNLEFRWNWGEGSDTQNCADPSIFWTSPAPTPPPTPSPGPAPCLSLDTPVFLLRGTETVLVAAGEVVVGDVVIGEKRVARVLAVERWEGSAEVCTVPADLCGEGTEEVLRAAVSRVTPNHAVRCESWEKGDWMFCDETWERATVEEVVNIQLESYFKDSVRTVGALVEAWDGAGPGEVCGAEHTTCKNAHMWIMKTLAPLRFNRYAIRTE